MARQRGVIGGGRPQFGRGQIRQAGRMPGDHGEAKGGSYGGDSPTAKSGTGMRKEKLSKAKGVSRIRP